MNKQHFELYIKGIVQGVWFRKTCAKVATDLGLCGFVKNMTDGSVLCEVEGNIESLIDFMAWCEIGPKDAIVEKVLRVQGQVKNYQEFSIK